MYIKYKFIILTIIVIYVLFAKKNNSFNNKTIFKIVVWNPFKEKHFESDCLDFI